MIRRGSSFITISDPLLGLSLIRPQIEASRRAAWTRPRIAVQCQKMEVSILNSSGHRVPRQFLQAWIASLSKLAARELDPKKYRGRELVLVFVDTKTARKLNREYRGKDYATDVLSFESEDDSSLGELVISPEVIAKQAREHGLLVREELGYMVLHGFLHLLGYDHERSPRDEKQMLDIQDRLFEKLLAKVPAR